MRSLMVILAAFAAGVVVDNFIAHFDIGLTIGLNWPGLVWHALNLGALVLVLVVLTWTARAVWRLRRGRQG
jgi:hypothetical protein